MRFFNRLVLFLASPLWERFAFDCKFNRRGHYIEFPQNSSVWFSNDHKKSYFHSFAKDYIWTCTKKTGLRKFLINTLHKFRIKKRSGETLPWNLSLDVDNPCWKLRKWPQSRIIDWCALLLALLSEWEKAHAPKPNDLFAFRLTSLLIQRKISLSFWDSERV